MIDLYNDIIDYEYFTQVTSNNKIIKFNEKLSNKFLTRTKYKNTFFYLAPHYIPQQHITTCGIASAIILLNAIYCYKNIKKPFDLKSSILFSDTKKKFGNFIWNEQNFFNKETNKIINKKIIIGEKLVNNSLNLGVSLQQLTDALNTHDVVAQCFHINKVSKKNIDIFRKQIKNIFLKSNKYIIVNYNIKIQFPSLDGGHFSPIAAYDEKSDYILVLDTWSSFTPWVWIKLIDLYKSMNTLDNNNYRGFISVE